VFDLRLRPRTCVRFDRHALYFGTPSSVQQCPTNAVGRTEAILLAPLRAGTAGRADSATSTLLPWGNLAASFVTHGVEVTATWSGDPGLVAAALGRRSLPSAPRPRPGLAPRARAAAIPRQTGGVYTGLGFDACHAPSTAQMSAWLSSPYRAIGVYLGGENEACSQPNLTAAWVSTETAAGWHLIPTFVGLQAPTNSCGCAAIKPAQASAQGAADASTAVANAEALGIQPGSPIYDDMEYYARGSNTSSVLAYLSAWTTQLHAAGYLSGVYGNSDSAIADLVSKYGTSYVEPDDIWFAQWDGVQNTSTGYVPTTEWGSHQRIHQYSGGRNQTYGGVTINVDGNYVDAATVGGPPPPPPPAPSLSVSPISTGITDLHPSWPREPGIASWEVLAAANADPSSLTPIGNWVASQSQIALRGTSPYFEIQALSQSGQVIGVSPEITTPSHLAAIGTSVFVSATTGVGTIPAGCYIGTACSVTTTITDGSARIARTGAESFRQNSPGLVRFQLYRRGQRMLLRSHRLAVTVRLRDASGIALSVRMTLIPYAISGSVRTRQIQRAAPVRLVGLTDFVSSNGTGGILADCAMPAPCQVTTTLSVGQTVIAGPRTGTVGSHELGYLTFSLTSKARAMLASAHGALGAHVALTDGPGITSGRVALVEHG
jgi:hypothetical protein